MEKKLNKKQFISAIAELNGIKKVQAKKELDHVLYAFLRLTSEQNELQLLGEFTTEIRAIEERTYDNPQDRTKQVTVPAHNKFVIKAGSKFQKAANGQYDFDAVDDEADED